jgi:MFS family permease
VYDPLGIAETDRRVIILGLARMADAIGNSFPIIILPLYISSGAITSGSLGLDEAFVTGIIISVFGFVNVIGQPLAGRFSDRTGRRRAFILLGLGMLAGANFAYSLANSYTGLLAVRALQGIGVAFTIPSTIALVNDVSTQATRGGSMGVFNTFRLIGYGGGPLLAGAVVHSGPYTFGGWQMTGIEAALYIAASAVVVSFLLVFTFVEDPEGYDAEAADDLDLAIFDHNHDHLLDPVFTLGLASLFMAVGIALIAPLETRINDHLNQTALLYSIEFAVFTIAQVLIQTPIGSASDKFGRKPFIVWGLALLAPTTLVQGFVVEPWQMILARLLQGVAGAMVFAPAFARAGDLANKSQSGTTLSVLTVAFSLGAAIGPLVAGYLIGFGYVIPFAFGGIMAALGAILVYAQVEETVTPTEAGAQRSDDAEVSPQD